METLGVRLRQTREAKGSTLEQAEIATRIRPRFLEALEAGDFSAFPGGEVQVRGFLRIYARYLDLPPDEVLARYDIEVHGVETAPPGAPAKTQSAPPVRPTTRRAPFRPRSAPASAPRPPVMNLAMLAIVSLATIVLLAVIVAGSYFIIRSADEETSTAATATATTTASAEVGAPPMATATPSLPAVTPTFPVNPEGGVTLALEATEHIWARVTVDGLMVFEGQLAPEQAKTWSGQEIVAVETGNGAGLLVTVNGQLQGTMCGRAEVCTRAWGPTGEVVVP